MGSRDIRPPDFTATVPGYLIPDVRINGEYQKSSVDIPIATTEYQLYATMMRSAKFIREIGGVNTHIYRNNSRRSGLILAENKDASEEISDYILKNRSDVKKVAESETNHGKVQKIEVITHDKAVWPILWADTDAAVGDNMITKMTALVCDYVSKNVEGVKWWGASGNLCSDKKAARTNKDYEFGRGIGVLSYATVPEDILHKRYHISPERLEEIVNYKCWIGSDIAMSHGHNSHLANTFAAMSIALGLDPGHTPEASLGDTYALYKVDTPQSRKLYEKFDFLPREEKKLLFAVDNPTFMGGVVGGGTELPPVKKRLEEMFGPAKNSKINKLRLAEAYGALTFGTESSTLSALANGVEHINAPK